MFRRFLVLAAVLSTLTTGCVSPPDDDAIEKFSTLTAMGRAQKRGILVVGIERDAPPFGFAGETGEPQGVSTDLGRLIADSLGIRSRFVFLDAARMPAALEDGSLDVGFPVTPITQAALEDAFFSDPYYVSHQRLLVPAGSDIGGTGDLAGKNVCQHVDLVTGVDVGDLAPGATVLDASSAESCLQVLGRGDAETISASDLDLMRVAYEEPGLRLVGEEINTTGVGAMVMHASGGFNGFINSVLEEAEIEGDWQRFYDRWVLPVAGEDPGPPHMSFEAAAALYPSE